jgi:hypothetical protein
MLLLLVADPRIPHAIVIISLLMIVPPVRREWHHFSSSTEDGKCKKEADDLGATVHTGAQNVVVLDEPVRPVLAHIEL